MKKILLISLIIIMNILFLTGCEESKKEKSLFLVGFTENVSGFTDVAAIKPLISGQPFIVYIFETDDPIGLDNQLSSTYDLRWNICTEADEFKISIDGKYVFVVMSERSFDEEEKEDVSAANTPADKLIELFKKNAELGSVKEVADTINKEMKEFVIYDTDVVTSFN